MADDTKENDLNYSKVREITATDSDICAIQEFYRILKKTAYKQYDKTNGYELVS